MTPDEKRRAWAVETVAREIRIPFDAEMLVAEAKRLDDFVRTGL